MATLTNPAEIARETLKQMMARRMAPSPDNYRAIYNEIAGVAENPADSFVEHELKSLLHLLPKENPAQQGLARQIGRAIEGRDWEGCRKSLADFIREHSGESGAAWGELIADFLQQWETKQSGLTQAKKRESLDHVLSASGRNDEILFGRLQSLVRSWSMNAEDADEIEVAASGEPAAAPGDSSAPADVSTPPGRSGELLRALRETFVFTLETLLAALLDDEPEAAAQARSLAAAARGASTQKSVQALLADIKRFAFQLEFVAEDRAETRNGLLRLLQLMIENIGELVIDDRWLNGQIEIVRDIVARPMNPRAISDAEHRLKEVVLKHSQLKHSLVEARDAMKQLLTGFVDHLADFADSTSDYHDKMERCVEKIGQADDIAQIEGVLEEVMRETRIVQLNAQRSRDDLRATKQRVAEAERRIGELQAELDRTSQLVRHDQLTGAFNRRGLDEIYEKEVARARRRQRPLCIALLDIDNFKKLNDSLGHDVGDAALIHLVAVIRETLRPQDTLARYGGEEFIITLPETPLEDAVGALVRVQRELTKRYFLNNNEKLLITFSAGVTEVRADDTQASAVKRADEATYTAKTSGKNRVVAV
ncbi:MAG: GGDEF domain-containing protein [Candidatus Accumulibacter sp.]|jgi:diguanylate cyclase|nr:GGDEF domain-containing protein [Accumulibacter sp.]